jgi:hypothetical protein
MEGFMNSLVGQVGQEHHRHNRLPSDIFRTNPDVRFLAPPSLSEK